MFGGVVSLSVTKKGAKKMKKKLLAGLAVGMLTFGLAGMAEAGFISNPAPVVSYSGNVVTLSKDLNGYGLHGVVDHASDILYSGETGTWSFDLASLGISLSDYDTSKITVSLALDDSYMVPTANYSLAVDLLGANKFSGTTDSLGLVHGAPWGTTFNNWTSASFDSSLLSDPFTVSIVNTTSISNQWVAIDTIELELTEATPVPEPSTMFLFGIGLLGLAENNWGRKKLRVRSG
jgi:hypothetical protein